MADSQSGSAQSGNFRFPASPPKEALDWFRAKGFEPGFDYRDVWREQHSHAFTVAKAMKMDVLTDIREALDQALAEGKTFEQFQKELTPKLQEKGWWGKQNVVDPTTGEVIKAQLGSPRRLRTIYSTNLRTARAAGQWQRIQRSKRAMPYLVYELGPSERHRPEHVSWAGILLPVDDPWWQSHYPPNGWGCKCRVRQISKREHKRLNESGEYLTTAPAINTKPWTNGRTGEVLQVPRGIDPGWDYNPGVHQAKALAENERRSKVSLKKAMDAPVPERFGAILDAPLEQRTKAFSEWRKHANDNWPLLKVPEVDMTELGTTVDVASLSPETLAKQERNHGELKDDEYANAQQVIDTATEKVRQGLSIIYINDQAEQGYTLVVKVTQSRKGVFVTSFRRLPSDQARRDKELQRLRKKAQAKNQQRQKKKGRT